MTWSYALVYMFAITGDHKGVDIWAGYKFKMLMMKYLITYARQSINETFRDPFICCLFDSIYILLLMVKFIK